MIRITGFLFFAFLLAMSACSRSTDSEPAGGFNVQLTFTPQRVTATDGSTVVAIDIQGAGDRRVPLEDVGITTSAGFDKVGGIISNGRNRFTAALQNLTDIEQSPIKVTVSIQGVTQTGYVEIVPGPPNGLSLNLAETAVSADVGEVSLAVTLKDAAGNVSPGAITLATTAGVVSQLVQESNGSYRAVLTGLTDTADSPVKVSATYGGAIVEAGLQILTGELAYFEISQIDSPLQVGKYSSFTASARDKNGNLVTTFNDIVTVRTSRDANDVDVDFGGSSATFTHSFIQGESLVERFLIKTATALSSTIHLVVSDGLHIGRSNEFVVTQAPANQLLIRGWSGYDLIVTADGCVSLKQTNTVCQRDATYENGRWIHGPMATRLEIQLRRVDGATTTRIGGRAADIEAYMTDADGDVFTTTPDPDLPYLSKVVDAGGGYYYVDVFNLRDTEQDPYTVTARFGSLFASQDVSVVPGELDHFEFPPVPSQRLVDPNDPTGGFVSSFFINLTARDNWDNQVFAFQDTVAVFKQIAGKNKVFLTTAPPMILGGSLPFAIAVPDDGSPDNNPETFYLVAEHGSGITGYTKPAVKGFDLVDPFNATTDFVILLPGQYDDNPYPDLTPFIGSCSTAIGFPDVDCAIYTPHVGELSSPLAALPQQVGEPFEILLIARTRLAPVPVFGFTGNVLLGALDSGIEVIDGSCFSNTEDTSNPSSLTPDFQVGFLGTDGGTGVESHCYVTVRFTRQSNAANIRTDPNRSSSLPLVSNVSSEVAVLSGPADAVQIRTIPSPQVAVQDTSSIGQGGFEIVAQMVDEFGNPTNNYSCTTPAIVTSSFGTDILRCGTSESYGTCNKAFDVNGHLHIPDAFLHMSVEPDNPASGHVTVDCGDIKLIENSNTFEVVGEGVGAFVFKFMPSAVTANEPFSFTAFACPVNSATCGNSTVDTTFNYRVMMTDTTGTLFPRHTQAFQNGVLDFTCPEGADEHCPRIDQAGDNIRVYLTGAGARSGSGPITVKIGQIGTYRFDADSFPSPVTVGEYFPLFVKAVDAGGNVMANEYEGRIYVNNRYGTVAFDRDNTLTGNRRVADVEADNDGYLVYRGTSQKLTVTFSEMNSADYLTITDNRGHTGYSLPDTFRVVYGPIDEVKYGGLPCPTVVPQNLRRDAPFIFCAYALDMFGNLKKDYQNPSAELTDSQNAMYPLGQTTGTVTVPFINGVARLPMYIEDYTLTSPEQVTAILQLGNNADSNPIDLAGITFDGHATTGTSFSISATTPPNIVGQDTAFSIAFTVKNGASTDSYYEGALKVTDDTGQIRAICGPDKDGGNCGFNKSVNGTNVAFTGNMVPDNLNGNPFAGKREQWFTIPVASYGNDIWVSDDFGHTYHVGTVDVEGYLDHFVLGPIPSPLAVGKTYPLQVTAINKDGAVMTDLNAPLTLAITNVHGTVNPTVVTGTFNAGVLSTSFEIQAANSGTDYLTVDSNGKTGTSNGFVAEDPALDHIAWTDYPWEPDGYVDYSVTLVARDQFGQQFVGFTSTVSFDAEDGAAARTVSPATSPPFSTGALPNLPIAINGGIGQTRYVATYNGTPYYSQTVTVQASPVAAIQVVYPSQVTQGCEYQMSLLAVNGSGQIVPNFTGEIIVRWGNPNPTNPGRVYGASNGLSFIETGGVKSERFGGGSLNQHLIISQQPPVFNDFFFGTTEQNYLNVYIEGSGIQGWTSELTVDPPGTCP